MKGKDIAIIVLSIIVAIQFIVILFLIPIKSIEDIKNSNTNQQWENITTDYN